MCEASDDTCASNLCNPSTGECEAVFQADGTSCEDGLYCTEDDQCSAGVCTGGTPRSCEIMDDVCQVGVCNEDLRQCIPVVAEDGTLCDDRQNCTLDDFCQAGTCMPGPTLVCQCPFGTDAECAGFEDGDKCNGSQWVCNDDFFCELADGPVICPPSGVECVSNVCDSFDGLCKLQDSINFMPCDDGEFCSVADYCLSGTCQAGEARSCADLDSDCQTGVCDEGADQCVANAKPDGTSCEADGAGCTIDECRLGTCAFLENVECSLVADDCNDGVCQNVGWGGHVCVKGPLPDGTVCTDEPDPCTLDTCQGGWCLHERLDNCSGPCGGDHPFDAGDDVCGFEDSCENGYLGYPNGGCMATCPEANCIRVASDPELGLPIDDKLACTMAPLDVTTTFQYVESIEAKVKVDHGYLADLTIALIDPQGYEHRIWDHIGGSNANFNNTFDLSMPVPYPFVDPEQQRLAGVPLCSFAGEQAGGTWWLKICDTGADNGGVLRNWKLYVRGSNTPDLNPGHRCETAIDLGNQDVNPAITVAGTTECAINSIAEPASCGGLYGPDRMYRFDLSVPKRVTVRLVQEARDLLLFLKDGDATSCEPGFLQCEQSAAWAPGAAPEVIDTQLGAGIYYVGVDTPGGADSAMYNYGPFSFELRVKTLLPNGAPCVDPVLGPQDLDCESMHCQNGFCCDEGDCCPGGEWLVPPDGTDPEAIKVDPDWISADTYCPDIYKADPVCYDADVTDPLNPINTCQGERSDANCVNNQCVAARVDDDVACDDTVESDRCGYFRSVYCGDFGPLPPWAQDKPFCPTFCQTDTDCDAGAHCDPAIATDPDPMVGIDPNTGDPLKWCQPDLDNGEASNEDSDCVSGHSQNGFCCREGDCCPTNDVPGALLCPAAYTQAPTCSDFATCTGHRNDPVCSDNMCGTVFVRDDCACGGDMSKDCGLFIAVFCDSATQCPATEVGDYIDPQANPLVAWESIDPQCLDNCETNGQDDDSKCDDIARCDLCTAELQAAGDCDPEDDGIRVCMANLPNGYPCDEDSDCENKLSTNAPDGHCENGFCCEVGTCCNMNSDCPTQDPPSGFWAGANCDTPETCQGTRTDAVCPALAPGCEGLATWEERAACTCAASPDPDGCIGALYSCGSEPIEDDSACVYDPENPADYCGLFVSIFCNGAADQVPPECLTSCLVAGVEDDNLCDSADQVHPRNDEDPGYFGGFGAHCDPDPGQMSNSICVWDLDIDEQCDENSDCHSNYCQMGFCCEVGGCCLGCRPTVITTNMGSVGLKDISAGEELEMFLSVGQPSVTEYRSALNRTGVDQGFMPGAVIRLNCWDLDKNLGETDVDCGGGECAPCETGQFCQIGARDCESGTCVSGICQ
jgi:subtilisin-like proprotein convertase family protein